MTNPLRTADDYELFIYSVQERFPNIQRSTLTFVRRGATLARVSGELYFEHGVRLAVLAKVGGWAESLLKARTPTQREILSQLIEQVTARWDGPKRRRLGPDYYDVEITWTELDRALRDVATTLVTERAA